MQRSVEFSFAVFPQTAAFFKPRKTPLNHPALGYYSKFMQLAALGNFNVAAQDFSRRRCKILTRISPVSQRILYVCERIPIRNKHRQSAISVGHVGSRYQKRMRQPDRINANVTLDSRHFFASIKPFVFRRVGVFDTLGIDNNERCFRRPPRENTRFCDPFFLKFPQGCCQIARSFSRSKP